MSRFPLHHHRFEVWGEPLRASLRASLREPLREPLRRLSHLSVLGIFSCLCFVLNLLVVGKTLATMRRAEGLEGLLLMLVVVFVPPALFTLGAFLGVLGVSRRCQASTVMGVALNVLGAVVYFAWVGIVRA